MRELLKGETASKSFSVDLEKEVVTVSHTVKPNEDSQSKYQLTWKLDFTGTEYERIFRYAARALVVDLQRQWRADKDRMDASKWDNVTFLVSDMKVREPADPKAKARKGIEALSDEEKLAFLKAELAKLEKSE